MVLTTYFCRSKWMIKNNSVTVNCRPKQTFYIKFTNVNWTMGFILNRLWDIGQADFFYFYTILLEFLCPGWRVFFYWFICRGFGRPILAKRLSVTEKPSKKIKNMSRNKSNTELNINWTINYIIKLQTFTCNIQE